MYADLIIANRNEIEAILNIQSSSETHPLWSTKLFDQIQLDTLFALLEPDSPLLEVWWDDILYEEEDVFWVLQVPPLLVKRLANLTSDERQALAAKWVDADSVYTGLEPFTTSDARLWIDDLCAFAQQAEAEGKSILLRSTT